mgnify:CR=1 FL=1
MLDQEKFFNTYKVQEALRILDFPGIRLRRFMRIIRDVYQR